MGTPTARVDLEEALRATRAPGSARCRLVTSTGVTLGEVDFARDESHWWPEDNAVGPGAMKAINVGGRSYWTTPEGWREIRIAGERSPGIGFLAGVFEPLSNPAWSIYRLGLLDEGSSPGGFVAVGEVATRSVSISVLLDGESRITRLDALHAPLIDLEDDEAIVPGYAEAYELYDFGAQLLMPDPPDADVLEFPA